MLEFVHIVNFFVKYPLRRLHSVYLPDVFFHEHRPCFTWTPPFSEGTSEQLHEKACMCMCVYTRLRESARGRNCRYNTVPEVANGWLVRLFEMEVSNSRVK